MTPSELFHKFLPYLPRKEVARLVLEGRIKIKTNSNDESLKHKMFALLGLPSLFNEKYTNRSQNSRSIFKHNQKKQQSNEITQETKHSSTDNQKYFRNFAKEAGNFKRGKLRSSVTKSESCDDSFKIQMNHWKSTPGQDLNRNSLSFLEMETNINNCKKIFLNQRKPILGLFLPPINYNYEKFTRSSSAGVFLKETNSDEKDTSRTAEEEGTHSIQQEEEENDSEDESEETSEEENRTKRKTLVRRKKRKVGNNINKQKLAKGKRRRKLPPLKKSTDSHQILFPSTIDPNFLYQLKIYKNFKNLKSIYRRCLTGFDKSGMPPSIFLNEIESEEKSGKSFLDPFSCSDFPSFLRARVQEMTLYEIETTRWENEIQLYQNRKKNLESLIQI